MAVLERLDGAVDGEFIAKKRGAPGEGGRVLEAGAAALAVRGLLGALPAMRRGERRQVAGATRAERAAVAVGAAEQATGGQQQVGHAAQWRALRGGGGRLG